MTIIRVASDLHLEAFAGRDTETLMVDFLPADPRDTESILVLAGDISSKKEQLLEFLVSCCKRFSKVIFVAGNHEFYKHNYTLYCKKMKEEILKYSVPGEAFENLIFSFDEVICKEFQEQKLRFIIAPLWADGGPKLLDQAVVGHFLNDFRVIKIEVPTDKHHIPYRMFRVGDMMAIHKEQKAGIRGYLEIPYEGKTVVVTHHLPSRRLVSKRFWPSDGSDGANGGFASDCDNMICTLEPNLWIHGHTHDTIDTELWKTRIVCNPAGYRGEYATPFNGFMKSELREDGSKLAVVVPKFVEL